MICASSGVYFIRAPAFFCIGMHVDKINTAGIMVCIPDQCMIAGFIIITDEGFNQSSCQIINS